jgi:hypothetical protein
VDDRPCQWPSCGQLGGAAGSQALAAALPAAPPALLQPPISPDPACLPARRPLAARRFLPERLSWAGARPERTNPNGSSVSLGHPIAATGTILAVKAIYELRRTGGTYALVIMCIGGGQGIAAIFERM